MLFVLSILGAICILFFIILVHELGHFIAARIFGMQTPVVGIGLPFWGPTWKLGTYKDTEFRFHPVLLGAYVAIPEMDDETANELEAFNIKLKHPQREFKPWQKIIVSLAGPFANIFFAFLLALFVSVFLGVPSIEKELIYVSGIQDSATQEVKNSLQKNDLILDINNKKISDYSGFVAELKANAGKPVHIEIQRSSGNKKDKVEKCLTLELTPNAQGKLEISLNPKASKITYKPVSGFPVIAHIKVAWEQFSYWFALCLHILITILKAPFLFVLGQKPGIGAGDLGGIMGAASKLAETIREQANVIAQLWAVLSIHIGLFNLVPILPLDGGQILFQTGEILSGGRKFTKLRDVVAQTGLFMMLLLLALVMFNDLHIADLIKGIGEHLSK